MSRKQRDPILRRGFVLSATLAAAVFVAQAAGATDLAAVKIGTADLIPTSTTYYGNGTTHTFDIYNPGAAGELCNPTSTVCPPEIRELARALKNNVDLIYDYVHNNIDTVWMFGLQKGPLGALIDKSGTPFDQAMLMVELLRWSGYTAGYKYGTITVLRQEFDDATNIRNTQAVCQLLSSGGIPADILDNSSPAKPVPADCDPAGLTNLVGSVTMNHVWVWVTISGTTYQFDPSFKTYVWKPILDWTDPAIMGFVSGQALTAAQTNMASGTDNDPVSGKNVSFVGNLNATQLNAKIQTYANTLLTYLASNLQGGEIEDLVGGGTISPAYTAQSPQRQTSLTGHSVTKTWNDIPDQYRTKLGVSGTMYNLNTSSYDTMFDKTFYVDEIYGRRLTVETDFCQGCIAAQSDWYNNKVYLKLDGALVALPAGQSNPYVNTPIPSTPQQTSRGVPATITLAALHPYAADTGTYMDTTVTKPATIITSLVIVHGWGDVSQALFTKWAEERDIGPTLPIAYVPHCVSHPEEVCPSFYLNQRGDLLREREAASWLAQNTRAARLNAALANATFQMHHAIGIVYGDARLQSQRKCADPGPICDEYRWGVGDSFDRIDVDMGFSLAHKTASAVTRRGAVHAIAAASAALEGSVMAQLADLPDTASTATRFEWGNAPPSSEDPFGGWRKFELYDGNNRAAAAQLVVAEGVTSTTNDGSALWNSPPEISSAETGQWRGALSSTIDDYAQAGFIVTTSQESFLGPGQRGGVIIPSTDTPLTYTHLPTKQRGGAFVATLYDANGDPVEIAHVVLGLNTTAIATIVTKGGGGSQQPDTAIAYNPSEAADVLKARFVDRSTALGVNLANGSMAFTSPASLSVGNSGFPYELSAGLIWHPGPRIDVGAPDSPTLPQPGWTTSWHNSASLSGSGMEAMGQSDIRAAAGTVAAFLVAQDIYKTSQSLARDAAGVLAVAWWTHQMQGNVVSAAVGGATRQLLRLANNTWIAPGAGYATLVQTGTRTPFEERCAQLPPPYAMARGWDASSMAFNLTNANGDVQHFAYWKDEYQTTDEDRCGRFTGFRLTDWSFPYGVVVSVDYGAGFDPNGGGGGIERITGVHNTVGRSIAYSYDDVVDWTFPNALADGAQASRKVTILTDDSGHFDPEGKETTFTYLAPVEAGPNQRPIPYSRLYRVFTAENLSQPNLEYTYDMLGRVKEAKDAVALQVGGRNPYQFLIADGTRGERVDPLSQSYVVDYDVHGHPARYIDEMGAATGHITLADIDGRGRVLSYTYPEGDREKFEYDTHNNTTTFTRVAKPGCTGNCADIVVSATWNQTWNKPATVVNARGYTTTFTYFNSGNGNGLLQKAELQAAAAGGVKPTYSFTYDTLGKVLTASTPIGITGNESIVTTNTYDATTRNLLTSTYDSGASPHIAALTTYAYDATASQDVTRITDPRGNVTEATYDLDRRKLLTMAHNGGAGAALLAETRTTYDAVGRVTKEEAAKCFDTASPCLSTGTTVATWIATRTITYTPTGKPATVKDADNRTTTTDYDNLDRVSTVTDPASRQTHFVYCTAADANCAANAVRVEQRAFNTNFQQDYATYTYTLNGKQATVTDADDGGHLTTFSYDSFDRLVKTLFPGGTHEDLAYYASGNLCSANGSPCTRTTRAGQSITYTYDRLDRMATKVVPGTGGRTATWSYDLAGRIELLTDTLGNSIDPHYDTAGRIDSNLRTVPGLTGSQTVSYQYDVAGNRTRLTWPGTPAYFVQYSFDALNRMTSASENNLLTLATFTYDALSRRTNLDYAPTTGGAHVTYTYTDAGDLLSLDHNFNGTANDVHFDYAYTAAHQLTSTTTSNANYVWQATTLGTSAYTHNDLNQYTAIAGTSYGYDTNGNFTTIGASVVFTFDAENHFISTTISTSSYTYDPLDHRASKTVNGVSTFFLGDVRDDEIGDYNANGTLIQRYIPGPAIDQPIAMVTVAGVRTYFHADRIGSVIAMSSDLGVRSEGPYTYDPYGWVCTGPGTSGCAIASGGVPFKFAGRRLDAEANQMYFRGRYYNFSLGRFLQTDPIGLQADLNLYAYVGNDPIDRTDPTGACPPSVCGAEGFSYNGIGATDVTLGPSTAHAAAVSDFAGGNNGKSQSDTRTQVAQVDAEPEPVRPPREEEEERVRERERAEGLEYPESSHRPGAQRTPEELFGAHIDSAREQHIFRNAPGHLPEATPTNRTLLEDTYRVENLLGRDSHGNYWYARPGTNGTQVWIQVRGDRIINGGVNQIARPFNPESGLSFSPRP